MGQLLGWWGLITPFPYGYKRGRQSEAHFQTRRDAWEPTSQGAINSKRALTGSYF
jgi:hypothetical protein